MGDTPDLRCRLFDASSLSVSWAAYLFHLTSTNMHSAYEAAGWGWNAKDKWAELFPGIGSWRRATQHLPSQQSDAVLVLPATQDAQLLPGSVQLDSHPSDSIGGRLLGSSVRSDKFYYMVVTAAKGKREVLAGFICFKLEREERDLPPQLNQFACQLQPTTTTTSTSTTSTTTTSTTTTTNSQPSSSARTAPCGCTSSAELVSVLAAFSKHLQRRRTRSPLHLCCYIYEMQVSAGWRGRGVGARMIACLERRVCVRLRGGVYHARDKRKYVLFTRQQTSHNSDKKTRGRSQAQGGKCMVGGEHKEQESAGNSEQKLGELYCPVMVLTVFRVNKAVLFYKRSGFRLHQSDPSLWTHHDNSRAKSSVCAKHMRALQVACASACTAAREPFGYDGEVSDVVDDGGLVGQEEEKDGGCEQDKTPKYWIMAKDLRGE